MKKLNNFVEKILPKFILIIPLIFIQHLLDNDFWFMANHGRYILENGFANIEPFTIHEGLKFSFEKWLSCIIFYKSFTVWEYGPIVVVMLIGALITFIYYKTALYLSKNKDASIVWTFVCLWFVSLFFLKTRPQIFSYVLLLSEFFFLEHYVRENKNKYLIPLPFLSLLYMQLHSTMWPMFFIFLLPYLCDLNFIRRLLKKEEAQYKKVPLIIVAIVSFAAGFINPYGANSVAYLFKSMGVNSLGLISELSMPTVWSFVFYGFSVILLIYLFVKKEVRENLPLRYLYFLLGTFIMTVFAIRNIAYFILIGGLIGIYLNRDIKIKEKPLRMLGACGLVCLILCPFVWENNLYEETHGYEILTKFTQEIGGSYEKNQTIKIWNSFNTGSYAEWLGYKTYIDPRAEVFLEKVNGKEDIIKEFEELLKGRKHYREAQEKYNFDYWIVEKTYPIATYMASDDNYEVLFEEEGYVVFKVE